MASRKSAVYNYYEVEVDGYVCQVEECGKKIAAAAEGPNVRNMCSNLKRHLKRSHADAFNKVEEEDNVNMKAKKAPVRGILATPSPKSRISDYFCSTNIQIHMTSDQFRLNIIDLVVRGGLSLAILDSEGMKNMVGEIASKLKVSLERHAIRDLIVDAAAEKREQITKELQGRPLCVKIDGWTRHSRSYLGVNVQFVDAGGRVQVRTLAVRDCEGKHSAEHMKSMLASVMTDFNISLEQLLAVVSDNAANMLKTVDLLNAEDSDAESEDDEDDNDEDLSWPDTTAALDSMASPSTVCHMRCAAHTLQLAVREGIRSVSDLLASTRAVVKKLRTPHLIAVIKKRSGLSPILDNQTRWSSTGRMLSRLLQLRPIVEELGAANPLLMLSNETWEQLQQIGEALDEPSTTTTRLQAADLTPGHFVKEWTLLKRHLRNNESALAVAIADAMDRRQAKLFQCEVFLAGVYVDLRYRLLLTEADITTAERVFANIVRREIRVRLRGEAADQGEHPPSGGGSSSSSGGDSSTDDEVELALDSLQHYRQLAVQQQPPSLEVDLEAVRHLQRVKAKSAFEAIDSAFPEQLKDAARTLTTLPVTQVSVERLFSALKFIVSDARSSMKADLVEAILLLRTNW